MDVAYWIYKQLEFESIQHFMDPFLSLLFVVIITWSGNQGLGLIRAEFSSPSF
jgi:hypothetical protein